MAGDEHRLAGLGELPDQVAKLSHPGRVEPVRRLVEDDKLWIVQERAGQEQALLHPLRVGAHLVAGAVAQPYQLQHLVDPRGRHAIGERRPHAQVVVGRQVGVVGLSFQDRARPMQRLGQMRSRIEAVHLHVAAAGRDETEDDRDRGRLARAVRPEEAVDPAAAYLQAQILHRQQPAIPLAQAHRSQDDVGVGSCHLSLAGDASRVRAGSRRRPATRA